MGRRYLLSAIAALCLLINCSYSTTVKPCKSGVQLADDKISIENCDQSPCDLKRGTNSSIEVVFTAVSNAEKPIINAYAMAFGMKNPYPGVDGKGACSMISPVDDDSKAGCPLEAGKEYRFKMALAIKRSYPKVNAVLHWAVKEKGSDPQFCFESDVSII